MSELDLEQKKKSGGAIRGIIIIVLLAVLGFAVYGIMQEPATPANEARATPEGALQQYCITVHRFLHQEKGGSVKDVMDCVPKEDAKWFDQHFRELIDDPFKMKEGLDPVVSGLVDRNLALANLLQQGPTRGDVENLEKKVEDDRATFKVRQTYMSGYSEDYTVELKKIGKQWKVLDFGGGKKLFMTAGAGGGSTGGN